MRGVAYILAMLLAVGAYCSGGDSLSRRADRAFSAGEWASAQALYALVTDAAPDNADAHARMMTAALMRGDSTAVPVAVERALASGVALGALLDSLRADLRMVSGYNLYPIALEGIAADKPYLRRPITDRLLDYYSERRDGAMMVRCAQLLLAGLPDSPRYLDALAWGKLYLGRRDEAEAAWRHALSADPDNAQIIISLATLLGNTPESTALLHRADSISPSPAIKARLKATQSSNH